MHYFMKNIVLKGLTGVLSLVLLMAVGQCGGPVKGGRNNPPGEPFETKEPTGNPGSEQQARLSLSVEGNLVKLVNEGSEKVNLNHFSTATALTKVKDYEEHEVTDLSVKYVKGDYSVSGEGGVFASKLA